eukprot:CAMPEP_0196666668 /NCGR_PEP_ID=MMETSP1086-20130531/64644_1 /TAXON_ID=77921 /ORGANISM="Cyanoptyche  gloeocystis , Strain SAG4.97" /LENGTH=272 /DNA_ID=CAMNT_0042003893 /DNA_START=537 /DNA_END=1355 /DNA_ORIENTATION=-
MAPTKQSLRLAALLSSLGTIALFLVFGANFSSIQLPSALGAVEKPLALAKELPSPTAAEKPVALAKRWDPLPTFSRREDFGAFLTSQGFEFGAEVGVQAGIFSEQLLSRWTSSKQYILIDCWRAQANYIDKANVPNKKQLDRFKMARERLSRFDSEKEILFFPMFSSQAARFIPDNSLDFVYLDARHDYCGVREDIDLYLPKLRSGGILAGHDYVTNAQVLKAGDDWGLCANGTRNDSAVKGAVEDFLKTFESPPDFQVTQNDWPSWIMRKP